ncbi:MAG: hypothetical protein H5T91_06130 [Synergistetes bacterium]|nr:hypothetical protein [Synergistota bacterium]
MLFLFCAFLIVFKQKLLIGSGAIQRVMMLTAFIPLIVCFYIQVHIKILVFAIERVEQRKELLF